MNVAELRQLLAEAALKGIEDLVAKHPHLVVNDFDVEWLNEREFKVGWFDKGVRMRLITQFTVRVQEVRQEALDA